jgi:hypothetical protein
VFLRLIERLHMNVRSKVRVPATVMLLAGLAVALAGATSGMHMYPPHTPIIKGGGTQVGALHRDPPHTPIIKG